MAKQVDISTGSFKELWKLSLPLMISFLSLFVMIFVDRLFLSIYSTETLNAATSAGTLSWSFLLGWTTLASLAEVFVAQYNGSKQYKKIGEPVWQMIWLGLISVVFFVLMGIFAGNFFYGAPSPTNHEHNYFSVTMYFGPFSVFLAALTAFLVGQGKTPLIKWLALLGNLINVILDPILIFGIKGFVPSMGINGACIATGVGIITQAAIMFYIFLQKDNRERYGTSDWTFKLKPFLKCLKVGMPPAVFVFFELLGWAIFYRMMSQIGPIHILVSSICQSILLLFVFFGLGLEKGAAAVAGNLIGSGKIDYIKKVLKSGMYLIGAFSVLVALFFVIYPEWLMDLFFKSPSAFDSHTSGVSLLEGAQLLEVKSLIRFGLAITGIYLVLEYARWLLSGILTAAGDTMFLMISGALCVWLLVITPTYFFILKPKAPVEHSFLIWVLYSSLATLINFVRFARGKWKAKALLIQTEDSGECIAADIQQDG